MGWKIAVRIVASRDWVVTPERQNKSKAAIDTYSDIDGKHSACNAFMAPSDNAAFTCIIIVADCFSIRSFQHVKNEASK